MIDLELEDSMRWLARKNRNLMLLIASIIDQVGGKIEVTDTKMVTADLNKIVYWYDDDNACGVYSIVKKEEGQGL